MKKVLKYTDFILFRLIPTMCSLFFLFASTLDSFRLFNTFSGYSLRDFLPDLVFYLCFVLLGFNSILDLFNKTKTSLAICKCFISVSALIYIGLCVADLIESIIHYNSIGYQFNLFDLHLYIPQIILIIVFLIVIICSALKDKFYKTKWILAILCSLLLFTAYFYGLLYYFLYYNEINLRMIVNNILFLYCYCAVVITGLSPAKTKENIAKDGVNE